MLKIVTLATGTCMNDIPIQCLPAVFETEDPLLLAKELLQLNNDDYIIHMGITDGGVVLLRNWAETQIYETINELTDKLAELNQLISK